MIFHTDLLVEIFCDIDDFCKEFEPQWRQRLVGIKRNRLGRLTLSEVMTIVIFFHFMRFRTFKDYYTLYAVPELRGFFPGLLSYSRFVYVMKLCLFPIFVFSQGCLGRCTGIGFIDSTILTVCHIKRIHSHRVFHSIAKRGKTTTGWFFGFKLHLIINERGEILAYRLTPGNSVHNKLKNCCQIEHHRHRSPWNFLVNLIGGILAYSYDPKKPSFAIESEEIRALWLTNA